MPDYQDHPYDDGPYDDDHEHGYDDVTGEPFVCPVYGCWVNDDIEVQP